MWDVLCPVTAFKTWGNAEDMGDGMRSRRRKDALSTLGAQREERLFLGFECSDWTVSGIWTTRGRHSM